MGPRLAPAAAIAALLLAAATPASAQIGRVAGTIADESGRPLKGATVTAWNRDATPSTLTGTSNARGQFSILGLKRGSWVFTIQAPGYEPARTVLDVVTIRPNPPLNIKLIKGSDPAPPSQLAGVDAKEIQRRIETAESLAASGDLDASIAAYRELLSRVPALTAIYMQIGALQERKRDTEAAAAAYQQLLKLEPGHTRAQTALARLAGR